MLGKEVIDTYIEFMQDLLMIDDVDVITDSKLVKESISVGGVARCYPTRRELYFDICTNDDLISKLIAITHEFRHMYQWDCVNKEEFKEFEDDSKVKEWKENFDNYINVGNDGYDDQPLEVDAEAFTYHVVGTLFNISTNGFRRNNQEYMNRYLQISSDIKENEILESVNYSGLIDYMEELKEWVKEALVGEIN